MIFIIANKIDLIDNYLCTEIPKDIINNFITKNTIIKKIYYVSAKTGKNVNEALEDIIYTIIDNKYNKFYEIYLDEDKTTLINKPKRTSYWFGLCPFKFC